MIDKNWIVQLVAYPLGTGEVLGSNPGKGENFSMKMNKRLNSNLNGATHSITSYSLCSKAGIKVKI